MAKYRVNIPKTLWFYTEVEASNEEEALDKAYDLAPSLCAQCGGWGQDHWSVDDGEWGNGEGESEVELVEES